MPPRKRTHAEVDDSNATPTTASTAATSPATARDRSSAVGQESTFDNAGLIHQIRNLWEFAALSQYVFSFGRFMKLPDDLDVDVLETECLRPPHESRLLDIGLTLLKFISSHRGLTHDNFDEYTRRQYIAKAPTRNPFGDDLSAPPNRFNDFDVIRKIRVLHQLTVWTLWNPDRWRERIPEQKELDQTNWRINEFGYDKEERVYYLLDDNRLYRRTDPPISEDPPVTPTRRARPKSNTKRARALARAAKRRKLAAEEAASEGDHDNDDQDQDSATAAAAQHSDRNQGYKWECVAISLAQYREFVEILKKSKDPNEQILRDRIIEHIIPVVEKWEESQQRKIAKRERELLNMARMATAKKSSRLAEKHERERQEREAAEAEKRLQAQQESAARKEKERAKTDEERRRRLMKRERRMQDREERRKHNQIMLDRLHEEAKQLAHSGETNVAGRMSERRLKNEIARRREEMDSIRDDESWVFDCAVCGVHGENLDDGQHSVSCEECNVWQHSECLGIPKDEAEKPEFHFICGDCKRRREEEERRPKIAPLKFRVAGHSPSAPDAPDSAAAPASDSAAATSPSKESRQSRPSMSSPKLQKTPISSPVSPVKKSASRKASLPAYPPVPIAPYGVPPFQQGYAMAPPSAAPVSSTSSHPYVPPEVHRSPKKTAHISPAYQYPAPQTGVSAFSQQQHFGLSSHPQQQVLYPAPQDPAVGYPQYPPPISNNPESSVAGGRISSYSSPSSAPMLAQPGGTPRRVYSYPYPPQQQYQPGYPPQSPALSHQSPLSNQTTPRHLSYSQPGSISSGISPIKHSPATAPPPPPLSVANSPNNPNHAAVVPPQRLDPSPRTTTFPSAGPSSVPYNSAMPPPLPPPVKHMPDIEERKRRTSGMRLPSSSHPGHVEEQQQQQQQSSSHDSAKDAMHGNGESPNNVSTQPDDISQQSLVVHPPPLPPVRSVPPAAAPAPDDNQQQQPRQAKNIDLTQHLPAPPPEQSSQTQSSDAAAGVSPQDNATAGTSQQLQHHQQQQQPPVPSLSLPVLNPPPPASSSSSMAAPVPAPASDNERS